MANHRQDLVIICTKLMYRRREREKDIRYINHTESKLSCDNTIQ